MNDEDFVQGFYYSLIFVLLLVIIYYVGFRYFTNSPFKARLKKEDRENIKGILARHFWYYQKLSLQNKIEFEKRVFEFIQVKEFIPRQLPEVTLEMKTLISACCIQLIFGFPSIQLAHFKRILVYPDAYYSTINRRYHKGEVNPAGRLIVISWKSFVDGYIHHSDSINLGLHEMAHALRLENMIKNQDYKFLDPALMKQWQILSMKVMSDIRMGTNGFFRQYAQVNEEEFFAVAIENFFERPEDFKKMLPDLYDVLVRLLRQDPLKLF